MCVNCLWEDWESEIAEALDYGLRSEFCESVLEYIQKNHHITDAQARGVRRWLDNFGDHRGFNDACDKDD